MSDIYKLPINIPTCFENYAPKKSNNYKHLRSFNLQKQTALANFVPIVDKFHDFSVGQILACDKNKDHQRQENDQILSVDNKKTSNNNNNSSIIHSSFNLRTPPSASRRFQILRRSRMKDAAERRHRLNNLFSSSGNNSTFSASVNVSQNERTSPLPATNNGLGSPPKMNDISGLEPINFQNSSCITRNQNHSNNLSNEIFTDNSSNLLNSNELLSNSGLTNSGNSSAIDFGNLPPILINPNPNSKQSPSNDPTSISSHRSTTPQFTNNNNVPIRAPPQNNRNNRRAARLNNPGYNNLDNNGSSTDSTLSLIENPENISDADVSQQDKSNNMSLEEESDGSDF